MPEFTVNSILDFDSSWIENVHVNLRSLENSVKILLDGHDVQETENRMAWALKAMTLTDLTTLSGDDCTSNVERLCFRACYPFSLPGIAHLTVAAVCVYPTKVKDAHETLKRMGMVDKIGVAAVATGFPTGLYPLHSRLQEISYAIENGATEIDIVVDRSLVLTHNWKKLYEEIVEMRKACGNRAHLKTILGIGECGTMDNVFKASMVCMMAGADFIKTSTGKEAVNANLPVGLVMIRAIQEFKRRTGKNIGLKPAGGVRNCQDAINWLIMVKETLGNEYLNPHLFRFGASGLLDDIQKFIVSNKHLLQ